MILTILSFSPKIPFLQKLQIKMIAKRGDIIDKTFGYLPRGETGRDSIISLHYKKSDIRLRVKGIPSA